MEGKSSSSPDVFKASTMTLKVEGGGVFLEGGVNGVEVENRLLCIHDGDGCLKKRKYRKRKRR